MRITFSQKGMVSRMKNIKIPKKLFPWAFGVGCAFILAGILLVIIGAPRASSAFNTTMLVFISIFMALFGGSVLWYLRECRNVDCNFFLYDNKTRLNIDVSELDFDRIDTRMDYFMSLIASSREEAWRGNLFDDVDPARFGDQGVYRPLVAFKMLLDLAETDTDEGWQLFTTADPSLIDSVADALRDAGEDRLPRTLVEEYNAVEDDADTEWIRDFLTGNVKYFRRRISEYVVGNINAFY